MAKKRITQITVERTAFLTTDYFAIDSATGTNNTGRISGPNLLAQLANGPTSPTFQVKLSTLATAGLGGVSRLARGFDIFGTNPKATTAAVENLFQVASNDAASPLALRFGIKTDATGGSRYGSIEVDDAGTKRNLILQPTGGNVGIGTTAPQKAFHVVVGAGGLPSLGSQVALFQNNSVVGDAAIFGVIAGASGLAGIQLGDDGAINRGFIYYDNSTESLQFGALSAERVRITQNGNLGLGQTTFGASAAKVLALGNGTIPGTIADAFQMVSADIVPGNAAPHFVTEAGPVIRLYQQAGIVDADGTLADATTKLNAVIQVLENLRLTAIA